MQRTDSFTTDELRRLRMVVHPTFGVPSPAKGSTAVVFKATSDGEAQALRFFTRADASSAERYGALHDHFTASGLARTVAMPQWIDDGIRVNGATWPVVRMQWVEGHTLNLHVDGLVDRGDTASLSTLANSWRDLVTRLQRADFAHGDLQHGNVLVESGGDLRLVDFDCSWIARFPADAAPSETGHRNYQPPNRPWGRWMDTFSGLVIYVSLLALSKNPNPWRELNTEDNLLFNDEDFRAPFDTLPWTRLSDLRDEEVDEAAARLKQCCAPGWTATGGLDELLAPREKPWWERTPTVVAPTAPQPATHTPVADPVVPPPRAEQQPVLPRTPTANWWKDQVPTPAVPGPRAPFQPRPSGKRPTTGAIIAVAVAVGLLSGLLTVAGMDGGSGAGGIGAAVGLIAMVITIVVGLARRD
ncbi:Serine/threonine protein kinase [Alloactinosynnema sp. L-07]|nr:Serine/threonine protein kinase [Alloactinosynnema sp. L-07]